MFTAEFFNDNAPQAEYRDTIDLSPNMAGDQMHFAGFRVERLTATVHGASGRVSIFAYGTESAIRLDVDAADLQRALDQKTEVVSHDLMVDRFRNPKFELPLAMRRLMQSLGEQEE